MGLIIRGTAEKGDNTLTHKISYVTFAPAYLPGLWRKPSSNVAGCFARIRESGVE
jgi:hypothetical protein